MAVTCQFNHVGAYLWVKASGVELSLADSQDYARQVVAACRAQKIWRMLLDERNLSYQISTMDAYEFGEWLLKEFGGEPIERIACLVDPTHYEATVFFETVARNRGILFQLFRSETEAVAWLTQDRGS